MEVLQISQEGHTLDIKRAKNIKLYLHYFVAEVKQIPVSVLLWNCLPAFYFGM